MTKKCTCGYAIGDPRVPECICKSEFVGLSDKAKLHFIKMSERVSILDLINAIEEELRLRNDTR